MQLDKLDMSAVALQVNAHNTLHRIRTQYNGIQYITLHCISFHHIV